MDCLAPPLDGRLGLRLNRAAVHRRYTMPSGKGPGLRKAKPTTTDTKKKKDKKQPDKKVSPDLKG